MTSTPLCSFAFLPSALRSIALGHPEPHLFNLLRRHLTNLQHMSLHSPEQHLAPHHLVNIPSIVSLDLRDPSAALLLEISRQLPHLCRHSIPSSGLFTPFSFPAPATISEWCNALQSLSSVAELAITVDINSIRDQTNQLLPQQLLQRLPPNLEVLLYASPLKSLMAEVVNLFHAAQLDVKLPLPVSLRKLNIFTGGGFDFSTIGRAELEELLAKEWEQLKEVLAPSGVEVVVGEPWSSSDEVVVGSHSWELKESFWTKLQG